MALLLTAAATVVYPAQPSHSYKLMSQRAPILPGWLQVSLAAEDIRNEKVKVLKCMKAMSMDDVVLGQYRARSHRGQNHPGYLDDKTVPPDRSPAFQPCR